MAAQSFQCLKLSLKVDFLLRHCSFVTEDYISDYQFPLCNLQPNYLTSNTIMSKISELPLTLQEQFILNITDLVFDETNLIFSYRFSIGEKLEQILEAYFRQKGITILSWNKQRPLVKLRRHPGQAHLKFLRESCFSSYGVPFTLNFLEVTASDGERLRFVNIANSISLLTPEVAKSFNLAVMRQTRSGEANSTLIRNLVSRGEVVDNLQNPIDIGREARSRTSRPRAGQSVQNDHVQYVQELLGAKSKTSVPPAPAAPPENTEDTPGAGLEEAAGVDQILPSGSQEVNALAETTNQKDFDGGLTKPTTRSSLLAPPKLLADTPNDPPDLSLYAVRPRVEGQVVETLAEDLANLSMIQDQEQALDDTLTDPALVEAALPSLPIELNDSNVTNRKPRAKRGSDTGLGSTMAYEADNED